MKKIHSFNGDNFEQTESTSFVHDGVKLTEYEDEPFIVGDYKHNQVEFFHSSHKMWYTATSFRNDHHIFDHIFGYAAVSRTEKVFILGGCCDQNNDWSTVTMFDNDEWKSLDRLKQGRINFMAITYGSHVMIVGGSVQENKW